jgi:hypothetical protein
MSRLFVSSGVRKVGKLSLARPLTDKCDYVNGIEIPVLHNAVQTKRRLSVTGVNASVLCLDTNVCAIVCFPATDGGMSLCAGTDPKIKEHVPHLPNWFWEYRKQRSSRMRVKTVERSAYVSRRSF